MKLLAGLLLLFVLAAPAQTVPAFYPEWTNIQQPVEQQSPDFFFGPGTAPETWVINPTPCAWDVDDQTDLRADGDLAAGTTIRGSSCVIADGFDNFGGDDHRVEVWAAASKPGLTLTLANSEGLSWVVPMASSAIYGWEWKLCGVVDRTPGPYPVIDGSNGGTGKVVTYTLTVTAGIRTVRSFSAILQTGMWGYHRICPPYP